MKTKLLKKVRKRFAIIEVTKVGRNDLEYVNISDLEFPFYVVIDTDSIIYYLGAAQTYKDAFEALINAVVNAYKDKATRRLESTKVYYNGK